MPHPPSRVKLARDKPHLGLANVKYHQSILHKHVAQDIRTAATVRDANHAKPRQRIHHVPVDEVDGADEELDAVENDGNDGGYGVAGCKVGAVRPEVDGGGREGLADGLGDVGWQVAKRGAAVDNVRVLCRVGRLAKLPAIWNDGVERVLVCRGGLVHEVGLWTVARLATYDKTSPRKRTCNDHIQRRRPAGIQPGGSGNAAPRNHTGRVVAVDGDAEERRDPSLTDHAREQRRVLDLAGWVMAVAAGAEIRVGEGWKGEAQQAARLVVAEPVGRGGKTSLLPLDRQVPKGDVGISHGPAHNLSVPVVNVHVLPWDNGARRKAARIDGAKRAGALGHDLARVVDARKVALDYPRVGATGIQQKGHRNPVPDYLGRVLRAISIGRRDILVAKPADLSLVGTEDGSNRPGVGLGSAEALDSLRVLARAGELGRDRGTTCPGNLESDARRRVPKDLFVGDGSHHGRHGTKAVEHVLPGCAAHGKTR